MDFKYGNAGKKTSAKKNYLSVVVAAL